MVEPEIDAGPPAVTIPFRSNFDSHVKEAELAPSTVKRWSPVVKPLGHDNATAISRTDIVAWKDALLSGGMSNITVRDTCLAATRAMLQFALDEGRAN